jgi:hypothetical protein
MMDATMKTLDRPMGNTERYVVNENMISMAVPPGDRVSPGASAVVRRVVVRRVVVRRDGNINDCVCQRAPYVIGVRLGYPSNH